jgi:hypothetical protein
MGVFLLGQAALGVWPLVQVEPMPLPLLIGLAAVGIAALLFGGAWLTHFFIVRAARKELAAYKDQVVALSDKIDALKERHKILPFFDQDFAVPMAGETLAAYNEVAQRLEHHRHQWLTLMDAWEQAQSLLDSERLLGYGRAQAARRRLREAAAPNQLESLLRECEVPLDRIEQAHEKIAADLKSYENELQQLAGHLQAVETARLSVSGYQPERSAAAALVDSGKQLLPGDPLGTLRRLDVARSKIAELTRRATKILQLVSRAAQIQSRVADVEQTAIKHRSEGLMLREEGAYPDPLLAEAQSHHGAAIQWMNQADDAAAEGALNKAAAAAEEASQAIERHVAARTRCAKEIPRRQGEARRLEDLAGVARGQQAELERDFAARTWMQVAENTSAASSRLRAAAPLLAQADHLAQADVQRYLEAGKRLDEAADHHKQAETLLNAVGVRLRELQQMRTDFHGRIGRLQSLAGHVQRVLQGSSADRAMANEQFRAAHHALESLVYDSRLPQPDWPNLVERAHEIEASLERSEQLARQDMALAQQAAEQIARAESMIMQAASFHEHGFRSQVGSAQSLLAQARNVVTSQAYEEAIRLAASAEQAARAALQQAMAAARRRQEEREAQLRAQQQAPLPLVGPTTTISPPVETLQAEEPLPADADFTTLARERQM